jgi:flavorubredoxin
VKAPVVYESMFGITKQIAHAVADGLHGSAEVEVAAVSDAPREPRSRDHGSQPIMNNVELGRS